MAMKLGAVGNRVAVSSEAFGVPVCGTLAKLPESYRKKNFVYVFLDACYVGLETWMCNRKFVIDSRGPWLMSRGLLVLENR